MVRGFEKQRRCGLAGSGGGSLGGFGGAGGRRKGRRLGDMIFRPLASLPAGWVLPLSGIRLRDKARFMNQVQFPAL